MYYSCSERQHKLYDRDLDHLDLVYLLDYDTELFMRDNISAGWELRLTPKKNWSTILGISLGYWVQLLLYG